MKPRLFQRFLPLPFFILTGRGAMLSQPKAFPPSLKTPNMTGFRFEPFSLSVIEALPLVSKVRFFQVPFHVPLNFFGTNFCAFFETAASPEEPAADRAELKPAISSIATTDARTVFPT